MSDSQPVAKGTTGVVLGKFMPPHLGHLYLTEMAASYVDRLMVVVEHIQDEPIPSALRHAWMKELLPRAEVLHLTTSHPQDPTERDDFWDLWRTSLLELLPAKPDFVFGSEAYGARLAQELHATFVPVDPARSVMPISGTEVRRDPLRNFRDGLKIAIRRDREPCLDNVNAHEIQQIGYFELFLERHGRAG